MAVCSFEDVRICGVKTVVPEHCIDIDDELQYFDNNPKKLARQKKMNGYGRRYIAFWTDARRGDIDWRGIESSYTGFYREFQGCG